MKEVYFDRYFDKKEPNECWEWKNNKNNAGYGRFTKRFGKTVYKFAAHRISWMFHYNMPIPDTLLCCHMCDNPPCVNPRHIMIGTHKANAQDAKLKGRKGSNHIQIAYDIKSGMPKNHVAIKHGIKVSSLSLILKKPSVIAILNGAL